MQLGPAEILVIVVVTLLVFGPDKLPKIIRQVGHGLSEFRRFQDTLRRDLDDVLRADDEDHTPPTLRAQELEPAPRGDPVAPEEPGAPDHSRRSDREPPPAESA